MYTKTYVHLIIREHVGCVSLYMHGVVMAICQLLLFCFVCTVSFGSSPVYNQVQSTSNVTLFNVTCNDQAKRLAQDCRYDIIMGNETLLYEQLVVGCYEKSTCTEEGEVRLVNGNHNLEGRVEVCSQGVWGTIKNTFCGDRDRNISKVVCRQLGYPWECELHVLYSFTSLHALYKRILCRGSH